MRDQLEGGENWKYYCNYELNITLSFLEIKVKSKIIKENKLAFWGYMHSVLERASFVLCVNKINVSGKPFHSSKAT